MPVKYFLFSLLAVAIWAGNTIVSKLAAGAIPPGVIAFDRWFLAFLLVTPFVAKDAWRHRKTVGKYLPKLTILGLLGMAVCQGLGYYAASFTSATNMAILLSLVPLLTLMLSALFLSEKPSSLAMLGGVLSLCGIFVVLGKGDPSLLLSQGVGRGDAIMLIAVLAYAGYGILIKKWSIPLAVWTSLYVQMGAAVVVLLPGYLMEGAASFTPANVTMILYTAIPGSIVAPFVWMSAVKHLGAGRTAIFMNLIPVITAIVAALFLDEALHVYHLIGGGMTIAGIVLVQRKPSVKRGTVAARVKAN
ncbi:DMT family transporter [Rhizobium sp. LCM 4573]|uniref:DMT family transporter n=1 Tax=Rhizobium sp. LCM 4573 TaxID=1848291 RepID=UPI0008D9F094|nr:DMT family transporter [Rhizobium sp. LCM 4573]OHV82864.1 multidrug DMT transporter [Rhizobium sp. LCM 4573]